MNISWDIHMITYDSIILPGRWHEGFNRPKSSVEVCEPSLLSLSYILIG